MYKTIVISTVAFLNRLQTQDIIVQNCSVQVLLELWLHFFDIVYPVHYKISLKRTDLINDRTDYFENETDLKSEANSSETSSDCSSYLIRHCLTSV